MHMVSVGERVDTQVAVPHLVNLQEAKRREDCTRLWLHAVAYLQLVLPLCVSTCHDPRGQISQAFPCHTASKQKQKMGMAWKQVLSSAVNSWSDDLHTHYITGCVSHCQAAIMMTKEREMREALRQERDKVSQCDVLSSISNHKCRWMAQWLASKGQRSSMQFHCV